MIENDRRGKWKVRFYFGANAKPPQVPGELAIETIHTTDVSRDIEIEAGTACGYTFEVFEIITRPTTMNKQQREAQKARIAQKKQEADRTAATTANEAVKTWETPEGKAQVAKPVENPVMKPDPANPVCGICKKPLGGTGPEDMVKGDCHVKCLAANRSIGHSAGPMGDAVAQASTRAIEMTPRQDNRPKARDERMRQKGRFPHGSTLCSTGFDAVADTWTVNLIVPNGGTSYCTFEATHTGVHGAIEALWNQYLEWVAKQKEPT